MARPFSYIPWPKSSPGRILILLSQQFNIYAAEGQVEYLVERAPYSYGPV